MVLEFVEYLKDPYLVAKIQKFFGVEIRCDTDVKNVDSNASDRSRQQHASFKSNSVPRIRGCHENKINGYKKNVEYRNGNSIPDKILEQDEITYMQNKTKNCIVSDLDNVDYTITNHFWYYLFLFGTELGDEIFYSAFIPFWFWNIDGPVGRRVVLVWAIVMTIGQASKDVIRWPRPACPPAVRLQNKWSQEYGMPSTHAMIGISIPFSVVLFTMNRYIYSFTLGCTIAFLWCTLVCTSRLYLGMHTVLDIVAGLILAITLMVPLVPLVDAVDYYVLSNVWVLAMLIAVSIITIVYYPCSDKWTPTRGDTTMVVSVTAGVHAGAWLNYNTGALTVPLRSPPYEIMWPSYSTLGSMILRTVLGFSSVVATKATGKSLSYAAICAILNINSKELMKSENHLENKNKIFVDLVYKYVTCFMIGVNTVYVLPNVFAMIGIERPTTYTEMWYYSISTKNKLLPFQLLFFNSESIIVPFNKKEEKIPEKARKDKKKRSRFS